MLIALDIRRSAPPAPVVSVHPRPSVRWSGLRARLLSPAQQRAVCGSQKTSSSSSRSPAPATKSRGGSAHRICRGRWNNPLGLRPEKFDKIGFPRRKRCVSGCLAARKRGGSGPDTDSSQGFRDFIDNNVEAEALRLLQHVSRGASFHGLWPGFGEPEPLTWLGARTRTLRLGAAVLVLPWHNPVLLAEQAATLDLLSGGRLVFSASARVTD